MRSGIHRRYKVAYVRESALLDWMRMSLATTGVQYCQILCEPMVPEGTQIVQVTYDFHRQALAVLLSHESFDEIIEGALIPAICDSALEYKTVSLKKENDDEEAE